MSTPRRAGHGDLGGEEGLLWGCGRVECGLLLGYVWVGYDDGRHDGQRRKFG